MTDSRAAPVPSSEREPRLIRTGTRRRYTKTMLMHRATTAIVLTSLCAAHPSLAEPDDARRPTAADRLAAQYDFDGRDNPDPVPPDWFRAQSRPDLPRPGFPAFNRALIDKSVAVSGAGSIRLPAQAGSVCLRLRRNALPVFPDGDYLITAKARVENAPNARAFLRARFLDRFGEPIETTDLRSSPVGSAGWTDVSLEMLAGPDNAEWLQIDLELLQPKEFQSDVPLADVRIWPEDFEATAWFDEVRVFQLPQVRLEPMTPTGVFRGGAQLKVKTLVRDLAGEPLDGELDVFDVTGRRVVRRRVPIQSTGVEDEWELDLPKHGWYRVEFNVAAKGSRIGAATANILWLPELNALRKGDRSRFGIIADRLALDQSTTLPPLTSDLGTGFVHLRAWDRGVRAADMEDHLTARKQLVDDFMSRGIDVTLVIPGLPDHLAEQADLPVDNPFGIVALATERWEGYLLPLLDRFGQRVRHWQVGLTGSDHASWYPRYADASALYAGTLARLVPSAVIAFAWRADRQPPEIIDDAPALTMSYPPSFHPGSFEFFRSSSLAPDAYRNEVTYVVESHDRQLISRDDRLVDIARRAIEVWSVIAREPGATEGRLAIDHPWASRWQRQLLPEPEFGAWETLASRLGGRQVIAEMPAPKGVRCYLLAVKNPSSNELSEGALVGWNEGAPPDDAYIQRYLGDGPWEVVDLFGNTSTMLAFSEDGTPTRITFPESPIFIEGIDPYLARFTAAFRIEPSSVPPIRQPHVGTIYLENPWSVPISGRLKLRNPSSGRRAWKLTPRGVLDFNIPPHETIRLPFTFSFGTAEEAGSRSIDAVVRLTAGREHPPMRLSSPIELSLPDLEMHPEYMIIDGKHVVIITTIVNTGTRPRVLSVEVRSPSDSGIPTQRITISSLAPGSTVRKRFVLQDAAAPLLNQRLRIKLEDPNALAYLLKSVEIR